MHPLLLPAFAHAQSGGPLQRVPNSTLQMPTAPPTLGYSFTNAFGTLTGYGGGLPRKQWLLRHEAATLVRRAPQGAAR